MTAPSREGYPSRTHAPAPCERRTHVFPSSFDYVAAHSVDEAVAAKGEGGDDVRFLAGGQSLLPMMKIAPRHPGEARRHQRDPRARHARAGQRAPPGRRAGAPRRHRRAPTSRSARSRRRRRGSPIRWCATAARCAARSPTAIPRATGTRCCSPPAPTSIARGSNGERAIPIAEFVVDFFTNALGRRRDGHRGAHPGAGGPRRAARTRSSSARSATTRRSRSPRTSSSAATARSRAAGLALTAVNAGEHQGHRGRGRCSSASSRATSCSPRPASSPRRRREPRDDVRGSAEWKRNVVRVFTRRALAGRGRAGRRAEGGARWRSPSRSTAPTTRTTSSRACCSSTSSARSVGLTGTHIGCDTTSCGACTVLVDGTPMKSCTMLAVQADGRSLTTVEGLSDERRARRHAGRVQGGARPAVRVLHAGDDAGRRRAARAEPRPVRRRRAVGDLREPLPLHRLHEHRQGHPRRRGRHRDRHREPRGASA